MGKPLNAALSKSVSCKVEGGVKEQIEKILDLIKRREELTTRSLAVPAELLKRPFTL